MNLLPHQLQQVDSPNDPVFDIEKLAACSKALKSYEGGSAGFLKYLIQQIATQEGYDTILNFDKSALKGGGFRSP